MPRKKKTEEPTMPPEFQGETVYKNDPDQEKAITHKKGPLLIVAGAGTGKTGVITRRIAYLINEKIAAPSEILALTFSDKAAKEMERRVDELVPYGMVDTQISTFHSFGYDIISDNFAAMRISPDWKMLQKADSIIFIVENIDKFGLKLYRPLNNPAMYVGKLVDFISKLKDNLITPQGYAEFVRDLEKSSKTEEEMELLEEHSELANFYKIYEELKTEKNYMDFGDLIVQPYYLLKSKKALLAKYQERFKYILIDEFQDTNYAQFELVKLIADKYRNISVVGDDDQMIYKFRGAAISNIKGFNDHYKDAEVVVLKNNYRSAQIILDTAYKLIRNNNDRLEVKLNIEKKLVSKYKPSHKINHLHVQFFDNYSSEADFVAAEIENYVKKQMYSYRDIAILVRSKNDAKMFLKTMEKKGIPYRFTGDEGLYNKKEVQFLINFCKALVTPYEFNPIIDVAISEFYRIDPYVISKIGNRSKEYTLPPYEMMKYIEKYPEVEIDETEKKKMERLVTDIEYYNDRMKEGWGAGEILYDYLKNHRILDGLLKEKTIEAERKIANISRFFEVLKQFSISEDYDTIFNFVSYIDLRQRAGDNPVDDIFTDVEEDSVQVATVHKAKGLEYKVVFVVALIQDKFPVKNRGGFGMPLPEGIMKDIVEEAVYHKEEERRLFYVAMTRAKDALYLTASSRYDGAGGKKISMFLTEIGASKPEEMEKKQETLDKIKYFEQHGKGQTEKGIIKKSSPVRLSNYQIDDYLTCPYKYKLIHVFRMPIKANQNVMYGQAMHKVASEYYKAKQEERSLSLEDLNVIFKAMWKPIGFRSPQHEQERFEKGLQIIKAFYDKEEQGKIIPKYIEKGFEFKLSKDIIVVGRWDRIDINEGEATIVDYKTSHVDSLEDAKKKLGSSDIAKQLTLYSLAYEKVFGKPVKEAGVYFFESALLLTKKFKPDTISKFEEEIYEIAQSIREEHFEAAPSAFTCKFCAFWDICEFSKSDVLF